MTVALLPDPRQWRTQDFRKGGGGAENLRIVKTKRKFSLRINYTALATQRGGMAPWPPINTPLTPVYMK